MGAKCNCSNREVEEANPSETEPTLQVPTCDASRFGIPKTLSKIASLAPDSPVIDATEEEPPVKQKKTKLKSKSGVEGISLKTKKQGGFSIPGGSKQTLKGKITGECRGEGSAKVNRSDGVKKRNDVERLLDQAEGRMQKNSQAKRNLQNTMQNKQQSMEKLDSSQKEKKDEQVTLEFLEGNENKSTQAWIQTEIEYVQIDEEEQAMPSPVPIQSEHLSFLSSKGFLSNRSSKSVRKYSDPSNKIQYSQGPISIKSQQEIDTLSLKSPLKQIQKKQPLGSGNSKIIKQSEVSKSASNRSKTGGSLMLAIPQKKSQGTSSISPGKKISCTCQVAVPAQFFSTLYGTPSLTSLMQVSVQKESQEEDFQYFGGDHGSVGDEEDVEF